MSTKKNATVIISALIVLVTLVWVVSESKNRAEIKEQKQINIQESKERLQIQEAKERLLEQKRLLEKEKDRRQEEQNRADLDVLSKIQNLEREYLKSTGFFNDDEYIVLD